MISFLRRSCERRPGNRGLAGLMICCSLLLSLAKVYAATYHVEIDGDDQASGTLESPWQTIQRAADSAVAGDLILVGNGTYNEIVTLDAGGHGEDNRISFQAINLHGARCKGFIVRADFITIEGFTIEAERENQYGIYVNGRNHVTIKDNHVMESPGGGINITGNSQYCSLVGNVLDHNGQWGIHVVGSHVLVENNEILRTVQHHPKNAFTGFHGEDADGLRIFGDNHLIRGNYIHDIGNVEDPGNHQGSAEYPQDFPHVDCLQSWDRSAHGGRPVIKDSVIERNRCSLSRASGKGIIISALDNGCSGLQIMNNIFEYRDIGISLNEGTYDDIRIYNNIFKARLDDPSWGVSLYLKDVQNYVVYNNIMIDGHAEARKVVGGTGVMDYNLVWYLNGETPAGTPGPAAHELWGVDPQFIHYTGENGGDYRLKKGSQAIDTGLALAEVTTDINGDMRYMGLGYDIGPYEYDPSSRQPGDINHDSAVDDVDSILILRILTGKDSHFYYDLASVDVNEDGVIGLADVIHVLEHCSQDHDGQALR